MSYETLTFERDGSVAIITLNRPDAANSLNVPMSEELVKVATHCDSNPDIRAVVLTATGKMFCAGGDLRSFAAQGDGMAEYMRYATAGLHAAISRFARMNAPYLVAVNGMAAGAGFSIAITGDLVFAAESAKFTEAYTKVGVSPDGSSTWFLPRLVGSMKAKRLIFLNDVLTAEQAFEWGLVTEVVPDDKLMERTLECAQQLAAADAAQIQIAIPRPGESVELPPSDTRAPVARWWPDLPWETVDEAPIVASGMITMVP